jgi:3-oxoacyl-[acyl-carrier protein] reductase
MSLKEKIILVTGASGGIGSAVALSAAQLDAKVFLGCRSGTDRAQSLKSQIRDQGGWAEVLPFDICDEKSVQNSISKIVADVGRLDGLVHCAGIHVSGPLMSLNAAEIKKQIDVNLTGSIFTIQAALNPMIAQRSGSIVVLGSVSAHRMIRGHSVYSSTKAGLEGLTKALAAEVAKRTVRVNCVIPGPVKTPMLEASIKETGDDPTQRIPMGRLIGADEVAAACNFLLSDQSLSITGACFPVDAGYMLL